MKFVAAAFVIAAALLALVAFSTVRRVTTEIVIAAEPSAVWRVLLDLDGYPEWHPIFLPLEGGIEAGREVRYRWTQPTGERMELKFEVSEVVENEYLRQVGGFPGLLAFDHRFRLEETAPGETRVTQSEIFRGLGLWLWDANQMQEEYGKVNQALRERVEAIAAQ